MDSSRTVLVNGSTAGALVVPGIEINDVLRTVQSQDRTTGVTADLTAEFVISDEDEIDNSGATVPTDSTGDNLYVRFWDRNWLEQEFLTPG